MNFDTSILTIAAALAAVYGSFHFITDLMNRLMWCIYVGSNKLGEEEQAQMAEAEAQDPGITGEPPYTEAYDYWYAILGIVYLIYKAIAP